MAEAFVINRLPAMIKNLSPLDRRVRVSIALLVVILMLVASIEGTVAAVLGFVALVLLLTGITGWCPAYRVFGFSTRGTTHRGAA